MKKILLTLFSALLALNVAADIHKGTYGSNINWEYNTKTYTLTISGSGEMKNSTPFQNYPWAEFVLGSIGRFEYYIIDDVENIIFTGDITNIPDECFTGAAYLTSVTFTQSITSIGENAFLNCKILANVDGYADNINIGSNAFKNTKLIDQEDGALYLGTSLIKVYSIGKKIDFKVKEGTTKIYDEAFANNKDIYSISFIPSSVTSFGKNMFQGCNLTDNNSDDDYLMAGDNIIVEVYDTDEEIYQIPSNIIYIAENAFEKCTNVKTIKCASTPAMATSALSNDNGPHLYVEDGNEDKFKDKGITSDKINHTKINLHSSGYNTIALDHSAIIPAGVEAYTVTSDGTKIHYKRVKGNKLAKGTGYFIVGTGNVTFEPAKESIAEGNDNNLVGVTEKTGVSGSDIYFLSTTQGGVTGFFCLGDDNYYEFPANKAYLQVSGTIGNAQYFLVNLDETETRIDNTESEEKTSHSRNNVYNLAGQKMSHPQKGINIVNGKLTIM